MADQARAPMDTVGSHIRRSIIALFGPALVVGVLYPWDGHPDWEGLVFLAGLAVLVYVALWGVFYLIECDAWRQERQIKRQQ